MFKKLYSLFNHKINSVMGDNNISQAEINIPSLGSPLHSLFPYREYDEEKQLFYNKNTMGFGIEINPLTGSSEQEINQLTDLLGGSINDETYIQFLHYSSPRVSDRLEYWKNVRAKHENDTFYMLAQDRKNFLERGSWGTILPGNKIHIRNFRCFVFVSQVMSMDKKKMTDYMIGYRTKFLSLLQSLSSHGNVVSDTDLINLMYELIHPSMTDTYNSNLEINKLDYLHKTLVKGGQSLDILSNKLVLDDKIDVVVQSVAQYPKAWVQYMNKDLLGNELSDFNRISYPMLQSFCMYAPNGNKAKERATLKVAKLVRNADGPTAKLLPQVRVQADEWSDVNAKLTDGERLIKTSLSVITYAKKGEAEHAEQDVKNIFRAKGWTINRDRYTHLNSFLNSMPFMPAEGYFASQDNLGKTRTLMSWSAANLANLQGDWLGMGSADGLLLLSRLGQPFFWDPYESPANYNCTVVGTSGSGKSFFMQEYVTDLAGSGGQIVIYDDGRSFENTCKLLGGQFVEFSANFCLNPYSLLDETAMNGSDIEYEYTDEEGHVKVADVTSGNIEEAYRAESFEMITNIVIQMADVGDNKLFKAKIAELVVEVWNEYGKKGGLNEIYEKIERIAEEDGEYKHLVQYLLKYSNKGEYGKYFNGEANIKIEKQFCVFELNELQSMKELQGLVMMLLMFMTNTVMYKGDRNIKKVVLMDEAWSLLANPAMTPFIEGMARRVRKYNGSLVIGTQSTDDFVGVSAAPAARAAWNNSSWRIYLMQNPDAILRLEDDERIKDIMKTIKTVKGKYSEVLILPPDGGAIVGRFYADPTSVSLFSSKAEDKAELDALVNQQGLTMAEALKRKAAPLWKKLT